MPSARRATAAPRRNARTPPRPQRVVLRPPVLRVRWDRAGRIALLLVLGVVVGLYVQHTLSYINTQAQASHQEQIVDSLARQNAALIREQESLNQPATIVEDARALGMVRPGERPYVITSHLGH